MSGSLRVCSILLLVLAFAHVDLARADPTIDEVYRQAHAGHLAKAQEMMQEVLRDHPNSAKAHYVMADLLAAGGQWTLAAEHLATARRLAPGLPFASPESVHELEQRLNAGEGERADSAAPRQPLLSFGWGSGIALLLAVALIAFVFRRRPVPVASANPSFSAPSYTPVSAVAPASSTGSGLGSAVATGLAAGAGVVAGEAIAEHLLSPNEPAATREPDPAPNPEPPVNNDDLGGNDFGLSDPSSWDDDPVNDDTDDPQSGGDGWN